MEKTLFLDAGNTRIKAAEKVRGSEVRTESTQSASDPAADSRTWKLHRLPEYDAPEFESGLRDLCRSFDRIVLSSVKKKFQADELERLLGTQTGHQSRRIRAITRSVLTADRHRYLTPETLGIDRYLACLGAWSLGTGPVIVTDAGTACTIDGMDAGGVYRGGVIMPGLHMLIKVLGSGADGLFPVSSTLPDSWPPDSTATALQAGTAGTFLAAWEAHVRRWQTLFPDARIWLTGGDANFLLKNSTIKAEYDGYLVFEGMRHWLEHDLEQTSQGRS